MRKVILWTIAILSLLGVSGAILVRMGYVSTPALTARTAGPPVQDGDQPVLLEGAGVPLTVPIMPADALMGKLSASGSIELIDETKVLVKVDGTVSQTLVEIGDFVEQDQLLLLLETTDFERELARAQVEFDSSRIALEKEASKDSASEIAAAEAELRSAREELTKVAAGPTEEETQAAQSKVAGAWAAYNELIDGPSAAQINEARANMMKAKVEVSAAQSAYNEIKWLPEAGGTETARELQRKTIDFEAAKAAFENVNKPSSTSDLQNALSTAQSAQDDLNKLLAQPTVSELASAEAKVRQAEKTLSELQAGSGTLDLQTAELNVKKALIDLEAAQTKLANAEILSPVSGTVILVDVEDGQTVSSGTKTVTIADLNALKVVINVAEADAHKISVGQKAEVKVDALRNISFSGVVSQINPIGSESNNVITFPVTVKLDEADLSDVRPNMSATVVLENEDLAANSWLVPQNAIQGEEDERTVTVIREEGQSTIEVVTGEYQGEWIVVQSDELREGDEVVGSVASFVDAQAAEIFNDEE